MTKKLSTHYVLCIMKKIKKIAILTKKVKKKGEQLFKLYGSSFAGGIRQIKTKICMNPISEYSLGKY